MQILPQLRTVGLPKPNCGVLSVVSDKSITNNNSCRWKETISFTLKYNFALLTLIIVIIKHLSFIKMCSIKPSYIHNHKKRKRNTMYTAQKRIIHNPGKLCHTSQKCCLIIPIFKDPQTICTTNLCMLQRWLMREESIYHLCKIYEKI